MAMFAYFCEKSTNLERIEKHTYFVAATEAVDPLVLDAKLVECCDNRCCDCDLCEIPSCICQCFGSDLTMGDGCRRVFVTLGQFSIVRLERESQLLIPVFDYCLPDKECSAGSSCSCAAEDPCELFSSISFPVNEFFPPNTIDTPCDYEATKTCCCSR